MQAMRRIIYLRSSSAQTNLPAQFVLTDDPSVGIRPRLHYTGLHRSVAIFIPDSGAVYTTP